MEIKLKSGELITVEADYVYEIDNETRVVKCVKGEKLYAPKWLESLIGERYIYNRKIVYKINAKEIVYIKE